MSEISHCTTMAGVRRHIDDIDVEIVALLAERWGYVRQASRIKQRRDAIVDRPRIEDVVAKVRAGATQAGLSPDLAERVWRPMIDAFIDLEAAEFERLRPTAPDPA